MNSLQALASQFRGALGCWLHERWRAECALNPVLSKATGISWVDLCNRGDDVRVGSAPDCRSCGWEHSSTLTVARVFPRTGGRLLEVVARQWPFAQRDETPPACASPLVSVIVPVAGTDRVPQFGAVLKNLFAQSLRQFEVIVVEHASAPEYAAHCPSGVRYIHLPRDAGQAFNKSRALNTGARAAVGRLLLLHDADVLVPRDYLKSIVERLQDRYDGLKPVRFIFYPSAEGSAEIIQPGSVCLPRRVARVEQNNPGISTVATREVYWAIGGHDERFEELGGDDNDFLDRLKTTRFFEGGFLPVLHLWHPTDPTAENSPRMKAFKAAQLRQPASRRIAELTSSRQ